MTEWRPVPSAPGYEASSDGDIRNQAGLVISATQSNGVYRKVALFVDGRRYDKSAHRLVLEAFSGPPPAGHVCGHLNGCPTDNRPANLVWITPRENERQKRDAQRQRVAVLREALEVIANGDEPRPVGERWRADGLPSKHDKCVHDRWMYEDCGQCIAEVARNALQLSGLHAKHESAVTAQPADAQPEGPLP